MFLFVVSQSMFEGEANYFKPLVTYNPSALLSKTDSASPQQSSVKSLQHNCPVLLVTIVG